jgi:hypothetical protein
MKHYRASVTREGKWWMVRVVDINGLTQARRLSEAELMARELIALSLHVPIDEVGVTIDVQSIGPITDLRERLARIDSERRQSTELERQATRDAAELARALVQLDVPLRDVGTVLGVSHQRAHQLVSLTS